MKSIQIVVILVTVGINITFAQTKKKVVTNKSSKLTHAQVGKDTSTPSAAIVVFLGSPLIDIIQHADSVKAFVLNPQSDQEPKLEGFTITQKPLLLSKYQIIQLRRIINTQRNWVLDKTDKLCPFVPTLGFEFICRGEDVKMLVCLECNMWRFIHRDSSKTEDCDPAHQIWLTFARGIFPNEISYKSIK
ncbi:hypothetical protein [Runella sp.]|uniref:hypothetical protein n=1 Tax=Runella sp. TaxID=1960881 RepID=UPI00301B3B02